MKDNKFLQLLKLKFRDPDNLFILIGFVVGLFYLGILQTILLSIGVLGYVSFVMILIGVFKYKLGVKALYKDIIHFALFLAIIMLFTKYHQYIITSLKAITQSLTFY